MGADNWTICPRCADEWAADITKRGLEVQQAYGTLPVEAFDELRASFGVLQAEGPKTSWREDYEIYTEGGVVSVSYSGACNACGLTHKFEIAERIPY